VKEFLTITHVIEGLELTAISGSEHNRELFKKFQEKYGIKNIYFDNDEMINSDVDTIYVAVPNNLHYEFTKKSLEAGKNVIVEKPMTVTYEEALELSKIARKKKLFLFEAITTEYLPNYKKIKELIPNIGDVKIVQCNFSQYSSRYDRFKAGENFPVFSPEYAGGALMDLNIYNIHYVVGLFGKPKNVEYYPNIERGIDTSGILILEYDNMKCICIGAKDCKAPIAYNIQGDKGCIHQKYPANSCDEFELIMNDGKIERINENNHNHRMINEFIEFVDMVNKKDYEKCYKMLDHSLIVTEVQDTARKKCGLVFPGEEK
ncbi:MAG TPA: NAD(P)-dependent oxidoreductase, partial [Clostridium sp.]|nr:NAD(P)-dependent oxidoreductase [Clostridium sp.]